MYSIVNYAIFGWVYLLWFQIYYAEHFIKFCLSLLATTIIGATILALGISAIKQKRIIERLLQRFKINKIHPVPTAWDYFFSQQEPVWLIVTLKSGKTVYGVFSKHSFASSDPDERDIYIEKVYSLADDETWIEDKHSRGILIDKSEIETIEFMI